MSIPACFAIGLMALSVGATADVASGPQAKIRFCDEILVTISAHELVQYEATVSPSGLIELAEHGQFPASGLATIELERAIDRALLEKGQASEAAVTIVRRDAPDCSLIDMPESAAPEKLPISEVRVESDTKPTIELWRPDGHDARP